MSKTIEIEVEKLQKLVDHFYSMCSIANELDIYEWDEGDAHMGEMKYWVDENFGRTIKE